MWFKNIQLYRFTQPFTLGAEELSAKLKKFQFKPCGKLQPASYGWVPPLGKHGVELTHAANGNIMICTRKEEKILPASVVRESVNNKISEIEAAQSRKLRRKEKIQIKDDVVQDLLPQAFVKSNLTFAYISPSDGLIFVNASSSKRAEEVLVYLRRSIETLPVIPIPLLLPPAVNMTRWVSGEGIPEDFSISDECELHADDGVIRCKHQYLGADEVQGHVTAGKQVVKLAIKWQDSVSCVVDDNFSINRLKFSDEIIEQADADDDYASQFDEDFSVMAMELKSFIPKLIDAFGGEEVNAT